jgi:hypothetical protein
MGGRRHRYAERARSAAAEMEGSLHAAAPPSGAREEQCQERQERRRHCTHGRWPRHHRGRYGRGRRVFASATATSRAAARGRVGCVAGAGGRSSGMDAGVPRRVPIRNLCSTDERRLSVTSGLVPKRKHDSMDPPHYPPHGDAIVGGGAAAAAGGAGGAAGAAAARGEQSI